MSNNNNDTSTRVEWTADDDVDVDEQQVAFTIRQAFGGAKQASPVSRQQPQPPTRVVTIPEINQAYRSDPTAAVIANIPPYERPEDIELWNADGRIERMVQWHDEADRRAEALRRNPRYEFSRLVKAFIGDKTHPMDNNIVDIDDPLTNVRVIVPPSVGLTAPTTTGAQINVQREAGGASAPAFALPSVQADEQRRLQDFHFGRQVNDALQTIGVSGRFQLDDTTVMCVSMALNALISHNSRKFRGHDLDAFLGDSLVMSLMARLTGTYLKQIKIDSAVRYHHDKDSDRRKREVQAILIEMDQKLRYDTSADQFVMMDDDEMAQQLREMGRRIRKAKTGRVY